LLAPFKHLRQVSLRSALRAPPPSLRCSPLQKSPRPDTARREQAALQFFSENRQREGGVTISRDSGPIA
jgi:hypothetical protein